MEASVCIEQKGTVEQVCDQNIKVKIHREGSCSHCNAQGICYLGDSSERLIEISDFTPDIKAGDHVEVIISRGMGNKAVVLSYLVPFLILIITLISMKMLGAGDLLAGMISLAALVPYFGLLYFLRDLLRKSITLSARKNRG